MSGCQFFRVSEGWNRRVSKLHLVLEFLIALLLFTCAWHFIKIDKRSSKENTVSNKKVYSHLSPHARTKALLYVCTKARTLKKLNNSRHAVSVDETASQFISKNGARRELYVCLDFAASIRGSIPHDWLLLPWRRL